MKKLILLALLASISSISNAFWGWQMASEGAHGKVKGDLSLNMDFRTHVVADNHQVAPPVYYGYRPFYSPSPYYAPTQSTASQNTASAPVSQ